MLNDRLYYSMPESGPDAFYRPEFLNMMEYHIPSLKSDGSATMIDIEPALALQYTGNLGGLLLLKGIPHQYHWIIMRCNNFRSPTEFNETCVELLIPQLSEIDQLQQIWSSTNNLNIG